MLGFSCPAGAFLEQLAASTLLSSATACQASPRMGQVGTAGMWLPGRTWGEEGAECLLVHHLRAQERRDELPGNLRYPPAVAV